ncbi:hypothetical protein PRVXH_000377 [Proteinivorax hydrogeniformans]|uniref:Uncharacterized protein n=1 Tax=Proteinivorax hydrogeniformans TaxID=1826727 RepID=A0AAU8HUL4_9FIRM
MLIVKNTPNNTGVSISGDYEDLNELYLALHDIVGEEGEFIGYDSSRIRVLGVCYDLRHAFMGHRSIELVDNGMNEQKMLENSTIVSKKNVYYKVEVLWTEVLFVFMVLNDFIALSGDKLKNRQWDKSVAVTRKFQSMIISELKNILKATTFTRLENCMARNSGYFRYYFTQYIDVLNIRFLKMSKDKKLKNISIMGKRIAEKGDEYQNLKANIIDKAKEYNCHPSELIVSSDYPEEIDW